MNNVQEVLGMSETADSDVTGARPSGTTAAFVVLVVIGGGNAVAVRLSSLELPPFWGAAVPLTRRSGYLLVDSSDKSGARLPRDRALVGAVLYGALGIGVSYSLLYWGSPCLYRQAC